MTDSTNPESGPGEVGIAGANPDPKWASTQRTLAVVGSILSLIALVATVLGLAPALEGYGFRLMAAIAALVLTLCCGANAFCWQTELRVWRTGSPSAADPGYRQRFRLSLVAHVVSYVAVLIGMYGTLEGSALAGWASGAGTLHGIAFILMIFGQIIGGTQYLRRSGPPGTIPTYIRRLNAKVQSLR